MHIADEVNLTIDQDGGRGAADHDSLREANIVLRPVGKMDPHRDEFFDTASDDASQVLLAHVSPILVELQLFVGSGQFAT
jgi:hypothetical protein